MSKQNVCERSGRLAVMPLHERNRSQSAEVSIMGLGYVRLTEAIEFCRAGFRVTGFDVDGDCIQQLHAGHSYLVDVCDAELDRAFETEKLRATGDFSQVKEMDAFLVAVPTPLSKTKTPDSVLSH